MGKMYRAEVRGEVRVFGVIRRRDDLPSMTLPLAMLMTAAVILFGSIGGRLASSDFVGTAASMPFLALAACMYALIILLWRRALSFVVTPLAFGVMLWSGTSLFAAVTISLSLLFTSYVFAVSLIARQPKFQRLGSLSLSIAICMILTTIAWAGFHAPSFDAFTGLCMDSLSDVLARAYTMAPSDSYIRAAARNVLVLAPALLSVVSVALAWFTEILAKSMFRLLGCTDLFIGITHRITLPLPYAVIYASVFALTLMTSPEQSPMTYTLLNSLMIAMMLPCSSVGMSVILRKIRARMYYASQKRALTTMLMIMAFAAMGAANTLLFLSAAGAYFVIADFLRKRKKQREKENRRDSRF